MKRFVQSVLILLVLAAFAALVWQARGGGGIARTTAVQPTLLPNFIAPGAGIKPGPTFTPIAPLAGAALLSQTQAEAIGLKDAELSGSVEEGSLSSVLGKISDSGHANGHVPDYPVWFVSATGAFTPSFGVCCRPPNNFSHMTTLVDAVTGSILGVQMTGLRNPPTTPTP